jgi:hypothetical protein
MGRCVFGWENRINTGTLSASGEALPVTNLQLDQADAGSSWQVNATSGWIRIDAGAAVTWRLFGLFRTNLTAAAQVTVRIGTTAGASDVALLAASSGVVAGVGQWIGILPAEVSGRHCEIAIADAANPDVALRVGLAFAGPAWQPARNASFRQPHARRWQATELRARGGQSFPRVDYVERTRAIALPLVTAAEAETRLPGLVAWACQRRNVLWVPDPDTSARHADAIFGVCDPGPIDYPARTPAFRTVDFTFTERL